MSVFELLSASVCSFLGFCVPVLICLCACVYAFFCLCAFVCLFLFQCLYVALNHFILPFVAQCLLEVVEFFLNDCTGCMQTPMFKMEDGKSVPEPFAEEVK